MELFNGNAAAIGLARYVRDFLPGPCHGVTMIRQEFNDGGFVRCLLQIELAPWGTH